MSVFLSAADVAPDLGDLRRVHRRRRGRDVLAAVEHRVRPVPRGRELEPEVVERVELRAVDLDGTEFDALYDLWFELAAAGNRSDAVLYGRQYVATAPPAMHASEIAEIRRYIGG